MPQTVEHQFERMTVGMVLDRAFRLYSQNIPLMFGITAVLNVPLLIVTAWPLLMVIAGSRPSIVAAATVSLGLTGLALLIIYPLVTAAITKAVSDRYLGNAVTVQSALKEAWASVGTLLLTQFVVGVMVAVGFLLLFVPGILWTLSYALVPSVVMLEASDRRNMHMNRSEIRRRSWELVRGNRGKVFVVLMVFVLMQICLSRGATWIAGMGLDSTSDVGSSIESIIRQVIAIVISPLQTIAITLLYYDFRIRKEGFDLEMLSQAIGGPTVNA